MDTMEHSKSEEMMMSMMMQLPELFHSDSGSIPPSESEEDFNFLTNTSTLAHNHHSNFTHSIPPPSTSTSINISFSNNNNPTLQLQEQNPNPNSMAAMREIIFRIAAMQPIHIDPESVKPPKRRNVKISKDPQSVAARHRRERISERIRILQRLVPGGTKMDTASMLDEAIHYVKFLKSQVQSLQRASVNTNTTTLLPFPSRPLPRTNPSPNFLFSSS